MARARRRRCDGGRRLPDSAFRGRGREFDQVVKYEYGDDIRDIDWNVTARLGEPYRKKFIEERELTVVLLFEDSLSLQFGSGERSKRDTLLEMAGLFALVSAGNRDRVGFWHATPLRRRGAARNPRPHRHPQDHGQPAGQPSLPDLDVRRRGRRSTGSASTAPSRDTAVMLWLGDFPPRVPPPAAWSALRRRYEVIGVRVDDPWERELPEAVAPSRPSTPRAVSSSPSTPSVPRSSRRHGEWVRAAMRPGTPAVSGQPPQRLVVSETRTTT